jgi:hypothetical protein
MSVDNDDHDASTALTVAAIGGGALLLWLVLRRPKGWGWGDRSANQQPVGRRVVSIVVRDGERVDVDGLSTDLATAVNVARVAGTANFRASGDARQGWVSKVFYALADAGVKVQADAGTADHLIRYGDNKTPAK